MTTFNTVTYGKWILAGEHSVLRGTSALVFPLYGRRLNLQFTPGGTGLIGDFTGEHSQEMSLLFWGVIEKALGMIGRTRNSVIGRFAVDCNVPVGAGLGASATLCAAVSRWLNWQGWVSDDQVYEFARELENMFHGESSGVDIAVALSGSPLEFRRGMKPQPLKPLWQPLLFMSYSGTRGLTSECVKKVQALAREDESRSKQIDARMSQAVEKAKNALLNIEDARQRLVLCQAIHEAATCFEQWDLTRGELGEHLKLLRSSGALAAKPTGSGQGGYVVSFWDKEPHVDNVKLEKLQLLPPASTTVQHSDRGLTANPV